MSLFVLGINHQTAPIALRERLAFAPESQPSALLALLALEGLTEVMLLSTCNRTEIYGALDGGSIDLIEQWLAETHAIAMNELTPALYRHQGGEAVQHLMRVASGLDSLILGEPQILGQLKRSYRLAQANGALGARLERLLQRAFAVGKRVRSETEIGASAVSVAYAAVRLARQIGGDLEQQRVLLVGAGETIELVARHLHKQGVKQLVIANRTPARAERLASDYSAQAVALEQLPHQLALADLVISSTASPRPLIDGSMLTMKPNPRPQLFIDLAVPRDIAPEVGELPHICLYTLDDLHGIVLENRQARQQAAQLAEEMVHSECHEFMSWYRSRAAIGWIRDYRQQIEQTAAQEVARSLQALAQGANAEEQLQQLAYRLSNKLSHAPTTALRSAGRSGDDRHVALIADILGLPKAP